MTPEEAGELLDWIADMPARHQRYKEAGGTRRVWACMDGCGWMTEAHNEIQARHQLRTCAVCCDHATLKDTGKLAPPMDFL